MGKIVGILMMLMVYQSACFGDVVEIMSSLDIPFLDVQTKDGEDPSCEFVDAPNGCWGKGIINATKVPARLVMTQHGDTIYDSGEYQKDKSGLTIKIRGNSSAWKTQKQGYKLKLQKKADLLRRGDDAFYKDKEWVLLASSGLNQAVGFWLSEAMGQEWTPDHQFVALRVNDQYKGLYTLTEQIKVGSHRVDIDEDTGYLIEADSYWWLEDRYFNSLVTQKQLKFTFKHPDPEDLTDSRLAEIQDDVHQAEKAILNGTYNSLLDCESFARWLICWDILGGNDAGGSNIYVVKDSESSPLRMGPLWDFDSILKTEGEWANIHKSAFYFKSLLTSHNKAFRDAYCRIWDSVGRHATDRIREKIHRFINSDEMESASKILTMEWKPEDEWLGEGWANEEMTAFEEEWVIYNDWMKERNRWIDFAIDSYRSEMRRDKTYRKMDLFGRELNDILPGTIYIVWDGDQYVKRMRR